MTKTIISFAVVATLITFSKPLSANAGCVSQAKSAIKHCNDLLKAFSKVKSAPQGTSQGVNQSAVGMRLNCKSKAVDKLLKKHDACVAKLKKLEK